jgi:multidrug efflux pump subunit AcrB
LGEFESHLMHDMRVKRVSATFGSEPGVISIGSGQLPAEAMLTITYVNRLDRDESSWQIERDLRGKLAALPGVTTADAFDAGTSILSTIKAPVDVRLFAEDWRLLADASSQIKAALERVPGFSSVSVAWDANAGEGDLVLNEDKLRAFGLTPEQVLAQLPLKGAPVSSMSKLPTVAALPVRSYFSEPYRSNPDSLRLLPIAMADGSTVSLGEISHIVRQRGLSLLTSDGNRYSLDVLAYRSTTPVGVLADKAMAAVHKVLPDGVQAVEMGDNAMSEDSSRRMMTGLAVGIVLLFGVLAPAYGSLRLALLSILILPLSAIGAVWGLLAFDKALALPAILGIILLFSIVIKNSILMADFIQERRKQGDDAMTAALDSIRLRYRPILMTAFGTIAGMIPIAMQRAVGLERLSPLADAAIGGLLVGTVLSLFYLPMFYVWLMGRSASVPAGQSNALQEHERGA